MFSVDTKGGNRPISLALKDQNVDQALYGKIFIMAYAFGDKMVVHDNWLPKMDASQNIDSICKIEKESKFALEESLHGREILATCAINLRN